jgi:hypothetical protein
MTTEPKGQAFVYVVMGTTGEYSDRSEWPVLAHLKKPDAERHVELASDWARQRRYHEDAQRDVANYNSHRDENNPHDPNMQVDYTGVSYYVLDVPLATELAERLNIAIIEPADRKVVL